MNGVWMTPRGKPVEFTYREGTNDWNTITSCLTNDEYGLRELYLTGLALDIGAYIGPVTVALLKDNPDLCVKAVEPVPENVDLLRQNLAQNGLAERAEIIEGAVGSGLVRYDFGGSDLATHHAWVGNMSLLHGQDVPHREVRVPVYSLARLAPHGASFVKIDCEGGEWGFLRSRKLRGVPHWSGEWHPTDGHTQADLRALLSDFALTFSGPDAGPQGFRAISI